MSEQTDQLFQEDSSPQFDEQVSYKETLVGEGKKFKDEEALARGKIEADTFIERLQRENAVLRGEIQKRETMDELVQRLTSQRSPKDTDKEVFTPPAPGSAHNDSLTPDQVRELLAKELAERQEKDRRSSNAQAVRQELVNRYGPNWQSTLKAKQEELGVSEQYLTDLAQTQPKVFMSLLGDAPKRDFGFTPPNSAIDTSKRHTSGNVRDFQYYEKLRKENFKEYMSPRVQNEIHEQARRLGDRFFQK